MRAQVGWMVLVQVEACDQGHNFAVCGSWLSKPSRWQLLNTVIKHCGSLQPPLLCGSDSSLSDSEESVFSGLEDSGSDSSEDYDEGVDGADCEKDAERTEETSEEQAQVGGGEPPWALLCLCPSQFERESMGR